MPAKDTNTQSCLPAVPFGGVNVCHQPGERYQTVLTVLGSEALAAQREVTRIHLRLWSVEELTLTAELGVTAADKRPGPCAGNGELLVREAPDGVVVGAVPVVKEPMEDRTGGRGLFLLSQLAEELEVHQLTRGKQVWSRLSHTSSGANEEGRC